MEPPILAPGSSNLTRTTLAVLFIGGLIIACFWVMKPFLSSLIWGGTIVIATWPFFLKLQERLWNRRWLTVLVMVGLLLLVLIVPICFAVLTILDRSDDIVGWFKSLSAVQIPPPPGWLGKIPMVGNPAVAHWQNFAATNPDELSKLLSPYASKTVAWFVGQAGSFSLLVLHFLLSVLIAAVFYVYGETAGAGIRAFARRLAGQQGEDVAILSAKAIRGVALGIIVTAIVQSALGGVGLFVAGVPAAVLLTAVMMILCIAQIGPGLVLLPAAIWLFYSGQMVDGIIFSIWSIFVGFVNNFLQPILIRKGVDLPMLLIITGVVGGLISFGIIGLFIGPVILAVTYTLVRAWVTGAGGITSAGTRQPQF
jgi:predicted PurR-regulated permease PerM